MNSAQTPTFDAAAFFRDSGVRTTIATYRARGIIFSQGAAAHSVLYIQEGSVQISVLAPGGKEAIVAMLGPGDFLGERALTGHQVRLKTATAMSETTVLIVQTDEMNRVLQEQPELASRFIDYVLTRNERLEADLAASLFNSAEKRLARALIMMARFGTPGEIHRVLPRFSHETLAKMVGTTRSRVNLFMNKFKKLGFIECGNGGVKVNHSLLTVILHDEPVDASRARSGRSRSPQGVRRMA